MSGQVTNTPVSPLLVNEQPPIAESSSFGDAVDKGAKDIHRSTKTAVEHQAFGKLSIIRWGQWVVSKCGFLVGCSLMLLVSPFLVPASIVYDGCRGVTLLCRKITKVETPVEKLLPKTHQHVKDVDKLLHEKTASDYIFQGQIEQLRAGKAQSDQLVNQLQWRNSQAEQNLNQLQNDWVYYHQNQQKAWEQDRAYLMACAGSAEQRVSGLTGKLERVASEWKEAGQEYQTEKVRLSAELEQLTAKLAKKDDQVKRLTLELVEAEGVLGKEKSDNRARAVSLSNEINQMKQALEKSEYEVAELRKQHDYPQGGEMDLTMTDLFGRLKDQFSRDRQELVNYVELLQSYITTLEDEIDELNYDIDDLDAECLDLQGKQSDIKNHYQENHDSMLKRINALENALDESRLQISILEEEKKKNNANETYKAESDRLKQKNEELKRESNELKLKMTQEQQKYKTKDDELRKTIAENKASLKDLRNINDKLEAEKKEAEKKCADIEKQLNIKLDQQSVEFRGTIDILTSELNEKKNKIQEIGREHKIACEKLVALEEQVKLDYEQLQKNTAEVGVQLESLSAQKAEIEKEFVIKAGEFKKEIDGLKKLLDQKENSLKKLEKENNGITSEKQEAEKQFRVKEKEINDELDTLKQKLEVTEQSHQGKDDELRKLNRILEDLSQTCQETETELNDVSQQLNDDARYLREKTVELEERNKKMESEFKVEIERLQKKNAEAEAEGAQFDLDSMAVEEKIKEEFDWLGEILKKNRLLDNPSTIDEMKSQRDHLDYALRQSKQKCNHAHRELISARDVVRNRDIELVHEKLEKHKLKQTLNSKREALQKKCQENRRLKLQVENLKKQPSDIAGKNNNTKDDIR